MDPHKTDKGMLGPGTSGIRFAKKSLACLHSPAQGLRNRAGCIIHCAASRAILRPEIRVHRIDVREHFKLPPVTKLWYRPSQSLNILVRLASAFPPNSFFPLLLNYSLFLPSFTSLPLSQKRSATDTFNYLW
jgi:hypothetical protein